MRKITIWLDNITYPIRCLFRKTDKQLMDRCLKELFKRVGVKGKSKIDKLTKLDEWYTIYTWSEEEQDNFSKWMKKYLKRNKKFWSDKQLDMEVSMFVLNYGWKTK